jgi:hypothetical protein
MRTPDASTREKITRKNSKRRVSAVLGAKAEPRLIVDLLAEMHQIVMDTAAELGVSAADRRRALTLAGREKRRLRPSVSTIQPIEGVARVLARWRFNKRYLRPDGSPRVLTIRGKGATFETLARHCVPTLPLAEVLELICAHAEVTRLKGEKLALIGSPVMIAPKTPEILVASLILRFRALAETAVYNAAIPANLKGTGRFERIVTGILTDKEFREFSQSVRQQLQDVCDRVDASIRQSTHLRSRRATHTCGLGMYVFKDDGRLG